MEELIKKAEREIGIFGRPSATTSEKMLIELKRLSSLPKEEEALTGKVLK